MTDEGRLILFHRIEATEDDMRDIVEDGYDYTEEEIQFLTTKLGLINTLIIDRFVESQVRDYLIDTMDEVIIQHFYTSTGIIRRKYPDIFECYLDSLDEEEVVDKLLHDIHLCDMVMARYQKYLENCSHANAMHNAIQEVVK